MTAFDEKLAAAIAAAGVPLSAELAVPDTDVAALTARLTVLEGQRAALAERLRAGQSWRQGELAGEELVAPSELREIFGIPLAPPLSSAPPASPLRGRARLDDLTVERAEATHWKRLGLEDPHDSPLHRTDRIPHDLPPLDGPR